MRTHCASFIVFSLFLILSLSSFVLSSSNDDSTQHQITTFKVNFSEQQISQVYERINIARLPPAFSGGWEYGVERTYFQEFLNYWKNEYNWTAQQEKLNKYPQFQTQIRGVNLHFLHIQVDQKEHANLHPVPTILLIHGWPGSVIEFYTMIDLLTNGVPQFNVVAASLPGFWFSELNDEQLEKIDPKLVGDILISLMQRLGYSEYYVHGGDWGGIIGSFVAYNDPIHCKGFHTTMPGLASAPFKGIFRSLKTTLQLIFPSFFFDEYDRSVFGVMFDYLLEGSGYFHIQATRPHTLGFALSDSPIGVAAYLLEKFRDWSDNENCNHESFGLAVDRDLLITNIMVYHLTNTITSSMRIYYEFAHSYEGFKGLGVHRYISVPTAVLYFQKEIIKAPRDWIEHSYNLVRYHRYPVGGHFAGLEQPSVLVNDIRLFYADLVTEKDVLSTSQKVGSNAEL